MEAQMNDSISRQAAIEAVGANTWAGSRLKGLPPAPPEPRWMPVEERLPREGHRVLITDEYGGIYISYFIDHSDIGKGIEWWIGGFRCYPIAWSELPEPYERSEDE